MNVSLYQAASAISANQRWQELIAENLSCSSIPGFKKQEVVFSAVEVGPHAPGALAASRAPIPQFRSVTAFGQGALRVTGERTDVAIEGAGFFEVQMPNGTPAYTRDGEFHVSPEGQLVTKHGWPVMGDGGPLQIDVRKGEPVSIAPSGELSQGRDVLGRIKLVNFARPEQLTPISGGCFVTGSSGAQPQDVPAPSFRQGCLESANASPVTEMASLITVMRASEASQRVIQMQDERLGRTITELGNPIN